MNISPDTLTELNESLQDVDINPNFIRFVRKWIAFNALYNEIKATIGGDKNKVREIAKEIQEYWDDEELQSLVWDLTNLECIGSVKDIAAWMLAPTKETKSITLYFRDYFDLPTALNDCTHPHCRPDKVVLCNSALVEKPDIDHWEGREIEALLMLIYQIRCNIIHGDKRMSPYHEEYQADRDISLVEISDSIMEKIIRNTLDKFKEDEIA